MRLVIAETGHPPEELEGDWPSYGQMFAAMFEEVGAGFAIETCDVTGGRLLPAPRPGDALLITGSPAGVYDGHSFIEPLKAAIRAWAKARNPVLGICFGHQIIASAFGARVEKSERGWAVGVHTYEVVGKAPWPDGPPRFACAVSHQDQVLELPQGFQRIAGSPFTPYAALTHETLPILSFQPHPEFRHGFAAELMRLRSDRIPAERVSFGLATLRNPTDRLQIAAWMRDFVRHQGT